MISLRLLLLIGMLAACQQPESGRGARRGEAASAEADTTRAVRTAITIDDLPWVGPLPPGRTRSEATRPVLAALRRRGLTATGFVSCGRVERGTPVLRLWLDAGMQLGNHTDAHLDLNEADLDAWIADARSCDQLLRELTGRDWLYFRYPYLHRGPTPPRYRAARAALDALGSRIAPVTIDTGDWILAGPYGDALRAGDTVAVRRIGDAYIEHVVRATAHYREVARRKLGRDVAHVLLLHANALLAGELDRLLERFAAEGVEVVPLADALRDPVYGLPDAYIGPEGWSWLYRIEPVEPDADAWDEREAARLRELTRR